MSVCIYHFKYHFELIESIIFLILLILLISKELVYHTIFHCTVFIVLLFYLYCTLCIYLLSPLITSTFMSLKIHSFKITHLSLYIFFLFAGDVYKRECRITAHWRLIKVQITCLFVVKYICYCFILMSNPKMT